MTKEYKAFSEALEKVLSVSHAEMKRREAVEMAARKRVAYGGKQLSYILVEFLSAIVAQGPRRVVVRLIDKGCCGMLNPQKLSKFLTAASAASFNQVLKQL
jgi:hypothetical protein